MSLHSFAFVPGGAVHLGRGSKLFLTGHYDRLSTFSKGHLLKSRRSALTSSVTMTSQDKIQPIRIVPETATQTTVRPRTEINFSIPFEEFVIRAWQPKDRAACVEIVGSVLSEYGLEWDPIVADREVIEVETSYKDGEFWVIEDVSTSQVVGTAGFYQVPHRGKGVIEIRKMYLRKDVRGKGLGSFLLSALEHRAGQLGYSKVFIETATVLKEATAMYKSRGYISSSGLETKRCDVILEKELTDVILRPDVEYVEAIDMTRGWTVACIPRQQALKHRIMFRAVAVLVESQGRIFVHRRSLKKSTYPGRMAVLITGCVDWNERPLDSAKREVGEEIGISDLEFVEPFAPFIATGNDGLGLRIQFHPFLATGTFSEKDIICNPDEVEDGEFMTREEILKQGIGGPLWLEFRQHGL